jgi:DNA-binding NtrC family response regulator
MDTPLENQVVSSNGDIRDVAAPEVPKTWLFVGDFLFYLRLLARQLSSLARQHGLKRKSMVIVPQLDMVWDQIAAGNCEVLILDCAESSEEQLAFLTELKTRYPAVRRILVSATLSRKMESELMHAGAHLCFAKPRNLEENSIVFYTEAITQ